MNNGILNSQNTLRQPSVLVTREGIEFFPATQQWRIRTLSTLELFDYDLVPPSVNSALLLSFKELVSWYLQNKSTGYSKRIFTGTLDLFRNMTNCGAADIVEISSTDFLNLKASLRPNQQPKLGALSAAFKKWHGLRIPGINENVISLLRDLKIKGGVKGKPVSTMCPETGPFTEVEVMAMQGAINNAYADGFIELKDYVLFWLLLALGARPVQLASLKLKDFHFIRQSDGTPDYEMVIPRAKQRDTLSRAEFKKRKLAHQIGGLTKKYVESLGEKAAECSDPLEAPFFFRTREASIYDEIPGFEHHTTGNDLGDRLSRMFDLVKMFSERTGEKIKISSYRFRYTLGTRAAEQGAGELVIAELLDHSDTQQVGVYVAATPKIIERIDRAVAIQIAPLAQAFAGLLVVNETQAQRGNDPSSRIIDPSISPELDPLGTCGKYGFCGLAAPIACYTCKRFQPWLDGPHEEMLSFVISERERILSEYGDLKVAAVNDRTIYAVAEVVRRVIMIKSVDAGRAN
jgi:integrase